jgi:hypothetical protein
MRQLVTLWFCFAALTAGGETWIYDFDRSDLSDWTIDGGEWRLVDVPERGRVLELWRFGKPPKEPVRRPGSVILAPAPAIGSFELEVDLRTLQPERFGADIIVIFGYQDPHHYYYAHISNDSDNKYHHVIYKVEGGKGSRTQIDNETDPEPKLKNGWQKLRLTRSADGRVEVFVDDMQNPTLTAEDSTWPRGRVGLGSFNDNAQFDNLLVRNSD